MSYVIEPVPLISFLENEEYKLPRFQRKATWKEKQNFELCISIFQDYPVGVVIINREPTATWLLDGRQRRNALSIMRDNPVQLYSWAKNYIGFKLTDTVFKIQNDYWAKVEKYLQTEEKDESDNSTDYVDSNAYEGEDEEILESSFNAEEMRSGLNTLLDVILMVHQIDSQSGMSNWEQNFDFRKYFTVLSYAPRKNGGKIDPVLLRKFILDFIKNNNGIEMDDFIEHCLNKSGSNKEDDFKNEVQKRWNYIKSSIDVISRSEKIFAKARIGMIQLTNATPLDAQNIFSRINKGGTQLKAEELLSAKPFWNRPVASSPTSPVYKLAETMYKKLAIPMGNDVVRWDLAATLIDRITEGKDFIFESYNEDKSVSMKKITLGFKLLSSIYEHGMSNKCVLALESNETIDWDEGIDQLINELNIICQILRQDTYFSYFERWGKSIVNLLGTAIALEFITIMWLDWHKHNRPQFTISGAMKALQRDGRILFDRLVFEYATKTWRGSGDSKMSSDIKNWRIRIQSSIEEKDWMSFIDGACLGIYNGQQTTIKSLQPVLYYYKMLKKLAPNLNDAPFDVDHVIPKELFVGNGLADPNFKDSLSNLALLPDDANKQKKAQILGKITDKLLICKIEQYEEIEQKDFCLYSDISRYKLIQELRRDLYRKVFSGMRNSALTN